MADTGGPGADQGIQLELAQGAWGSGDVAMVHAANRGQDRFDGGIDLINNRTALEQSFDVQDDLGGELGNMGQRGFDGLSVDSFGLPDEPGGVGITIGNARYVHGQHIEFSVLVI